MPAGRHDETGPSPSMSSSFVLGLTKRPRMHVSYDAEEMQHCRACESTDDIVSLEARLAGRCAH
jgi:hypothetical protein